MHCPPPPSSSPNKGRRLTNSNFSLLLFSDKINIPWGYLWFIIPDSRLKLPRGLIYRFNIKEGTLIWLDTTAALRNKRRWRRKALPNPDPSSVVKLHCLHRKLISAYNGRLVPCCGLPSDNKQTLETTFVESMLNKLSPCLLCNNSHQIKTATIMEHMGLWFIGFELRILPAILWLHNLMLWCFD